MERRNMFNFTYIDSFKIQTLARIFMFGQFIDESNGILFPFINNMSSAYKYLKYNLRLRSTEGLILKPIDSADSCMLGILYILIASCTLRLVTFCSPVCVRFILNKSQFVTGTECKRIRGGRLAGSITVTLKIILLETNLWE
jgi:hypothetical protein